MIYFEALSLLILTQYLIKFSRVSRRLSLFYQMIEKPLLLLLGTGVLLFVLLMILGLAAHQLWGGDTYEFRTM